MGNAPEVVRKVGVHNFRMAAKQQLLHLDHRLLGVSPATVGVEFRWKVGFEDRLQHQHRCRHADPIPQGWHTTSELHSYPTDLWDRLKSRIRFIHCSGGGSSF